MHGTATHSDLVGDGLKKKKKGRRVNLQENELSRYYHKEACLDAITCGEAWVMIMHLEQLSLPQIRI